MPRRNASRGVPYVPGLDGVRGLLILVVMAYHLEWSLAPGGFLSVSLFFTLSGYLITQLIVHEFESTGRLHLPSFWARRLRRLMPAALVTIFAIAMLSIVTPVFDGPRLRGDLLGALGYAANWRFAVTGNSYEDLFTTTASPVQHFWSLAIEEQFYFAFPLVMIGLLLLGRRWGRPVTVLGSGLVLLAAASVVAGVLTESRSYAYYGTHVRAVEIVVGALLALVLPVGRQISARASDLIAGASVLGLGVFLFLVATVEIGDGFVYGGGLAAFALVACLLILGSMVPGPVRAVMSWRPLVGAGKVSYGAYVYHWPIFVAMNEERMGFGGWGLDAVRLAAVAAVALLSYRYVEEPIRRRRFLVGRRAATVGLATAVAATVAVVFAVARPAPVVLAGVDAPDRIVDFDSVDSVESVESAVGDGVPAESRRRILVLGDDPSLGDRVLAHASTGDPTVEVVDRTTRGCPLRLGGGSRGGCPSLEESLTDRDSFDVLVIGVGATERSHVNALIGAETPRRLLEFPDEFERRFTVPLEYSRGLETLLGDRPTLILDAMRADELGNRLADLGARRTTIAYVDRAEPEVWQSEFDLLVAELDAVDDRTRVVVIGDSVSYGVARALNDVARDRYDVVWAGGRNCPLVDVQQIRWWEGVEFDMAACPALDDTWIPLFDQFAPEILLVVVSVPEQSDQQYEADGEWYTVGDGEFTRRHDETVGRLVALAESSGTRFVVFTSPTIYGGALGGAPFGRPERVAGWNQELLGYAERWPSIELFDWAEVVDRYETIDGGEPGSLRDDGVHMGEEVLADILSAELVPFLEGSGSATSD